MDNPAITYHVNGNIESERWFIDGKYHRLNKPAEIYYYENGNVKREYWFDCGEIHRFIGPAVIWYYENGNVESELWFINGNKIKKPYDNYPLTIEQIIEMKLKYG